MHTLALPSSLWLVCPSPWSSLVTFCSKSSTPPAPTAPEHIPLAPPTVLGPLAYLSDDLLPQSVGAPLGATPTHLCLPAPRPVPGKLLSGKIQSVELSVVHPEGTKAHPGAGDRAEITRLQARG